jgi:hypothetical protein
MTTIKVRSGTTTQWTTANPVLALGEPGYDSGTHILKVGDGSTPWTSLRGYLNETALKTGYASRKARDPREFGAVGDGVTDDTAALQACIDAAGASGAVELPPLALKISRTLTLPAGLEFRGSGAKESRLMVSSDICSVRAAGGQGQALRNFKVWNTFAGARTTYDIELASPTKPVIEDVEVDCNSGNTGVGGGIRIYKDAAVAGNSFMPQLLRAWVRYGHLRVDGVTDGKATDCFIWASSTTGLGAVQVVNSASSWTFTNCDVVPPVGDHAGYHLDTVENVHIQGGLVDGSYDGVFTGWGVRATNCHRLSVRTSFWNLGRGAVDLTNVRASSFVGNVISRCNKSDGAYDDIRNTNGIGNVFVGNTHSSLVARSAPGRIYVETGSATDNVIDCNVRETGTNYYASNPVIVQGTTYLGPGNRPLSAWPRVLVRSVNASETMPPEAVFRGQISFISGSGVTITLPTAAAFYTGTPVTVKNTGAGPATIAASGSQTINGVANIAIAAGEAVTIATSTSTAWQTISRYI